MKTQDTFCPDLFSVAESMDFGDFHIKVDQRTQLRAVVAIHDTTLGPALGGCRFVNYDSFNHAVMDAMRLAQGMSYKAALANLQYGGGKAVIVRPHGEYDRHRLFNAFGEFVHQLKGRYITAVDSGTSVDDMAYVAEKTKFVASTPLASGGSGDPSPYTALGVVRGIEAAMHYAHDHHDLGGVRVAVQGVGHVGYYVAKYLFERGARIVACDNKAKNTQRVQEEFGAEIVPPDAIYDADCEIFSPCALGGIINEKTVERLHAKIIVGAANNQLSSLDVGKALVLKDIVYAPDYIVNAGGLIHVALKDEDKVLEKVNAIYETLTNVFQLSWETGETTAEAADEIAKSIIEGKRTHPRGSKSVKELTF